MLTNISERIDHWARGRAILALLAAFVLFEALTFPILLRSPGGDIESLDARFFYKPEEAFSTIDAYGDARTLWMFVYLTWDLVNPIAYSLLLSLLIAWLFQRSFDAASKLRRLNLLPLAAGVFDLLENLSVVTLLATYPARLTLVAWLSTVFTMGKVVTLGASALLILVGVTLAAAKRYGRQTSGLERPSDGLAKERKTLRIVDLNAADQQMIAQTAVLLMLGFEDSWPDMGSALDEVQECLRPGKLNRVALNENGTAVGWIGGRSLYDGHVWELHPLVVHPDYQRRGTGRALVLDFEALVKAHGGITIYLGTDDVADQTNLAGVNVYPHVLEHLANIKNLKGHPYEFYRKMGFVIVGMVPDANGMGKPDIMMAKRVVGWPD